MAEGGEALAEMDLPGVAGEEDGTEVVAGGGARAAGPLLARSQTLLMSRPHPLTGPWVPRSRFRRCAGSALLLCLACLLRCQAT